MPYDNKILLLAHINSCSLPSICAVNFQKPDSFPLVAVSFRIPWTPKMVHGRIVRESHEVGFYKQGLDGCTSLSFTFCLSEVSHDITPSRTGSCKNVF